MPGTSSTACSSGRVTVSIIDCGGSVPLLAMITIRGNSQRGIDAARQREGRDAAGHDERDGHERGRARVTKGRRGDVHFPAAGFSAFGRGLLAFGCRLLGRDRRAVGQAGLSVDDDLLAGFHALADLGVLRVDNADDHRAALGLVARRHEDRRLLAFADNRLGRNEHDVGVFLRIDLDLHGRPDRERMGA